MMTTRVGLAASASALALAGAAIADEAKDYEVRIAELEAQVSRLSGDNWLTEERAEEIKGLVQDVLADADTRASLLQSGMTSGYDNGFLIGSTNGNFALRINGLLQVRFVVNNQEEGAIGATQNTPDEWVWGFENTRSRLIFSGHVVDPTWTYKVQAGVNTTSGSSFGLEDAWIRKDMGNGWALKVGQYKSPQSREFLVDGGNQLAIERSIVSYAFGGGRTQGIMLEYQADQFRFMGSLDDLASPAVTTSAQVPAIPGGANAFGLNNSWNTVDTDFSITGRAEFLLSGNWDQFEDFSSPMGSEQGIMAGIGAHYETGESGTAALELEYVNVTGDVSLEFDGWNLFGSIAFSSFDNDASATDIANGLTSVDFAPWGVVVQGGLFLTERLELFGRLEWASWDDFGLDGAAADNVDDMSIITIGLNHYYNEHVKASVDLGYALDAVHVTDQGGGSLTGFRTDNTNEDGQLVLRAQMQLKF